MRLLICSADTAQQMGVDWWKHDPFLTSGAARGEGSANLESSGDTRQLRERIDRLEASIAQREQRDEQ